MTTYQGEFANEINGAAIHYGVDPFLIAAIIKVESNFNPNAESPVGSKGLMQLMNATARDLGINDVFNPSENIFGGVKYIADKIKEFNGNIYKALIAFNGGTGLVDKVYGSEGGRWLEPKRYVKRVIDNYEEMTRKNLKISL